MSAPAGDEKKEGKTPMTVKDLFWGILSPFTALNTFLTEKLSFDKTYILIFYAVIGLEIIYFFEPSAVGAALVLVLASYPIWLPIIIAPYIWPFWMWYVNNKFLLKEAHGYKLHEIKLPREILKSVKAMELVFESIHNTGGEGPWWDVITKGKLRPHFSFELVSKGGQIHFYVHCRGGNVAFMKNAIYGQYPEVEIEAVNDYAVNIFYDPLKNKVSTFHFKKSTKPKFKILDDDFKEKEEEFDDDLMPIKTYLDFEMDKDPKEEYKVDPLAQIFEVFSSGMKPDHIMALQIIIRGRRAAEKSHGHDWDTDMRKLVKAVNDSNKVVSVFNNSKHVQYRPITKGDQSRIEALERNMVKSPFWTTIRFVSVAPIDQFNGGKTPEVLNMWRNFRDSNRNSFAPASILLGFDYWWQDYKQMRQDYYKTAFTEAYRARESNVLPPNKPWWVIHTLPKVHIHEFVMTSEELATIYHFPSSAVKAPGITRIPAKKAEPPSNLPM
jgi:hypothetical protein